MKQLIFNTMLFVALTLGNSELLAQEVSPKYMIRFYEDNDYINIRGRGTDKAYTNGTRLDLLYTQGVHERSFIDRLLPNAGKNSNNTYGWALMQFMYTPNDISASEVQYNDYPYAGALLAAHSLYSYNPNNKTSVITELKLGIRGPGSMAAEGQSGIHRLIHYQQPLGWNNQLDYKLLTNIDLSLEKGIITSGLVDVIAGSRLAVGSYQNNVTAWTLIRIGKKSPYFNGLLQQYSAVKTTANGKRKKTIQAYLVLKPEVQLQLTNAMVTGGIEPGAVKKNNENLRSAQAARFNKLETWVYSMNAGAVVARGNFGISFSQNISTALLANLYDHEVGNISLYFSW